MKQKLQVLPILFAFFVMGFCDVVGIATSAAQKDFNLSETVAGFIPSMVFIWFLLLSIPAALLMNKIGRKKTVQLSNVITFVGMLIPLVSYDFVSCMVAFVLLGVGNTILQVSLNPLLASVVQGKSMASALTAGQVVKAVSSFCGPLIAIFAASYLGGWRMIFPIYAGITLLCWLWLNFTSVKEEKEASEKSPSLGQTFGLLTDKYVLMCFVGIFAIVGIDVGTNTVSIKLMIERALWDENAAKLAASVYFACRTAGAFAGSLLLAKMKEKLYFQINMLLAIASIAMLFFVTNPYVILVAIGLIGFFCSSIFSVLFSFALKARPDKSNEISGLMITGVAGGAVIPPLMGVCTQMIGNQNGSLIVIGSCMIYLLFCAFSKERV